MRRAELDAARPAATTSRASGSSSGGCAPFTVTPLPGRTASRTSARTASPSARSGNDAPLFRSRGPTRRPRSPSRSSCRCRSPVAGSRSACLPDLDRRPPIQSIASADYYGLDRSLAIWVPDWPDARRAQPVPRERDRSRPTSPAGATRRRATTSPSTRARALRLPAAPAAARPVYVSYAYGFAAPIGGGEYQRAGAPAGRRRRLPRRRRPAGADEHDPWRRCTAGRARRRGRRAAVIEIVDSGVYTEPLRDPARRGRAPADPRGAAAPARSSGCSTTSSTGPIRCACRAGAGSTLHARRPAGQRSRPDDRTGPRRGGAATPADDLCEVVIRHCTLVPGWSLTATASRAAGRAEHHRRSTRRRALRIEHCIVGSIVVSGDAVAARPAADRRSATASSTPPVTTATGPMRRSTGAGRRVAHAIATLPPLHGLRPRRRPRDRAGREHDLHRAAARGARQLGCMRFCSVVPGSRTPRRFHCQPDRPTAALTERGRAAGRADRAAAVHEHALRHAGLRQLARDCPAEIRAGADDESEMGVFHDLFQPQRAARCGGGSTSSRPPAWTPGCYGPTEGVRMSGDFSRPTWPPGERLPPGAAPAGTGAARRRLQRAGRPVGPRPAPADPRPSRAARRSGRRARLRDRVRRRRLHDRPGRYYVDGWLAVNAPVRDRRHRRCSTRPRRRSRSRAPSTRFEKGKPYLLYLDVGSGR